MQLIAKPLIAAVTGFVVISCNGGSNDGFRFGNSGETGTLSLAIGDAPVDNLVEVNLTIKAIEFGGRSGSTSEEALEVVELPVPRKINLLDWQNGDFYTLFQNTEITAGNYDWVRLRLDYDVNPPEVLERGIAFPASLEIPGARQTGLKLHGNGVLVIDANNSHRYAIDIDLHRSILQTGNGGYKLKPSYRLIDIDNSYRISGEILTGMPVGCQGAIYVFRGEVVPDDIENPDDGETINGVESTDAVEPFSVVKLDGTANQNALYTVNHLAAGTYTLAFTCNAANDALDEDNDNPDQFRFLGYTVVEEINSDLNNVDIR